MPLILALRRQRPDYSWSSKPAGLHSETLSSPPTPKRGACVCWCSGKARKKEFRARLGHKVNSKTAEDIYEDQPASKIFKKGMTGLEGWFSN